MGAANSLKQRRNLAFCISELTITDKGVKKMIELVKNIKDALYDTEIFESFKKTVSKVKKGTRGQFGGGEGEGVVKSSLEEFELLLEGIRCSANGEQKGGEGEGEKEEDGDVGGVGGVKQETGVKSKKSSSKAPPKKVAKGKGKGGKKSRKQVDSSEDEMDDDDDDDEEEEEEGDENQVPTPSTTSKGRQTGKGKEVSGAMKSRRGQVVL